MKTNVLLATVAFCATAFAAQTANAQETIVVDEVAVAQNDVNNTPCKTRYYSTGSDNWFIQLGAGINSPFVSDLPNTYVEKHHITAVYNVAFGKWFSPYIGWRLSFMGGAIHWDNQTYSKAKYVNGNLDFMWDMFNTLAGVNTKRVFSIVPFVGLGGTYSWDFVAPASNILNDNGKLKHNQWTLPVSAGLQLRFRLCSYVDFFLEGRAQFYGDNFNNCAYGKPIDINLSAIGGFSFNIGGSNFKKFNPCDYTSYINSLNNQVNDLRGELAATAAALAVAESQLPCPQVPEVEQTVVTVQAPLMASVRFTLNSARISNEEMVNVYNTAEWMKANPTQNVVIMGYADKDTGTSGYNMKLSERRAKAVYDALVNNYGINPDRLAIQANGSDVQPYSTNNWNRIVIFNNAD